MIRGRNKNKAAARGSRRGSDARSGAPDKVDETEVDEIEVDEIEVDETEDADDDLEIEDEALETDDDDELDDELDDDELDDDEDDEDEDDEDEIELVDHSLRDDGPFDLSEVDIDDDGIQRLDLGCLILTPFEGMQLQLQVDEGSDSVRAALVMYNDSALEIALFAAPSRQAMAPEVIEEMMQTTTEAGGTATLTEGRFGTQIERSLPVEADGKKLLHVSRTWFAQGPRWLLRGTLMGEAITGEDPLTEELLEEFFTTIVVNRDEAPRVPGDLIPMTVPADLAAQAT